MFGVAEENTFNRSMWNSFQKKVRKGAGRMKVLKILCAGSVRKVLEDIGASFSLANPDISFLFISGGSLELARDLLACRERGDLFFSADYDLLVQWFRDAGKVSLVEPLVTNSKVLAFPRNSLYKEKLGGETWFRILEDPGVVLAHTAPDRDPGGYRTLLVLRLAENFLRRTGAFRPDLQQSFPPCSSPSNHSCHGGFPSRPGKN